MFLTAEVKRFFEAWQSLRANDGIPHYRLLFDALAPEFIPAMMVLEESEDNRYIVRFMGTTLVDLRGEDLTGKDRLSDLSRKTAAAAALNLRDMLATPCGATALQAYGPNARYQVESLLLPALNDPGRPRRVVGFGQVIQPAEPGGLAEAQPLLADERWVDIGFGVPGRRPRPVFSR
jgi:hypothetical protein